MQSEANATSILRTLVLAPALYLHYTTYSKGANTILDSVHTCTALNFVASNTKVLTSFGYMYFNCGKKDRKHFQHLMIQWWKVTDLRFTQVQIQCKCKKN